MPQVKRRRRVHKQRVRSSVPKRPRQPVETRQSLFGKLALFLSLLALLLLIAQDILDMQFHNGAPTEVALVMIWVKRGVSVATVAGMSLALLSFPFSSRRQRSAVLGLLLNVAVLAASIYLPYWRYQ